VKLRVGSLRIGTPGRVGHQRGGDAQPMAHAEKEPARSPATSLRPTVSSTASTRRGPTPVVAPRASECWSRRPRSIPLASNSAPTSANCAVDLAYGRPLASAIPELGRSKPRIIRIVVDLPARSGLRSRSLRPPRPLGAAESGGARDDELGVLPWVSASSGCLSQIANQSDADRKVKLGPCSLRDVRLRSVEVGCLWGIRTEVVVGQVSALVTGLQPWDCKSIAKASKVRILHLPPCAERAPDLRDNVGRGLFCLLCGESGSGPRPILARHCRGRLRLHESSRLHTGRVTMTRVLQRRA